jgi:hypothetical protein
MYFSQLKSYFELYGFKKTSFTGLFTKFTTTFEVDKTTVIVNWEMGGFISSVSYKKGGSETIYNSIEEFVEIFIR